MHVHGRTRERMSVRGRRAFGLQVLQPSQGTDSCLLWCARRLWVLQPPQGIDSYLPCTCVRCGPELAEVQAALKSCNSTCCLLQECCAGS